MGIDGTLEEGNKRSSTPELPETLVAGRQRRSTAGNLLAAFLDNAEADDVDLLFQEDDEEDDEFAGKEESDVELGSSSDEEDKAGHDEEYAGELELQQEARKSQAKKRKAEEAFIGQKGLDKLLQKQQSTRIKKVTIQEPEERRRSSDVASPKDIFTTHDVGPRQRKKSERLSWIPTSEDLPSRQSSRRQTIANKQMIYERMEESSVRRAKVIAAMEKASKKKKEQHVEWTQDMRLENAKKVEEQNRKSLNKWEEAEAIRVEQQRAKLAALHNRKLEGPMIRLYSAKAEWDEKGELTYVGRHRPIVEVPDNVEEERSVVKEENDQEKERDQEGVIQQADLVPIAEVSDDVSMNDSPPIPMIKSDELRDTGLDASSKQVSQISDGTKDRISTADEIILVPISGHDPQDPQDSQGQPNEQSKGSETLIEVSKAGVSAKMYIILENFNPDAINSKEYQGKILFPSNKGPLQKPERPLCVITNLPARFTDPTTGLPYASLFAFRQIQKVKNGDLRWNSTLQCFFDDQEAAAGVPDEFLL